MAKSVHQRHRIGNLLLFFAYYADGQHREQPALFLANANRRGSSYCIPLDHAHEFDDDHELMRRSFQIAERLGFGQTRSEVFRIADAILNYLPELVEMPPKYQPQGDPREQMEREGINLEVGS